MALTTSTSTGGSLGNQTSTQTPQASVGPASNAAPARNVQTGTANSLLTQSSGISLNGQALTAVSLDNTTTSTRQSSTSESTPANHHANPILLGLVAILLVAALIIVWSINRSAKNTTK